MSESRIKNIWYCMKRRCHAPAPSDYWNYIERNYHGKGICVCDEWRYSFDNFRSWAMSNGYADDLTIDRVDSDGNYEPSNCRWISRSANSARVSRKQWQTGTIPHKGIGRYEVRDVFMRGCAKIAETGLMYREARVFATDLEKDRKNITHRNDYFIVKRSDAPHKVGDYVWF